MAVNWFFQDKQMKAGGLWHPSFTGHREEVRVAAEVKFKEGEKVEKEDLLIVPT